MRVNGTLAFRAVSILFYHAVQDDWPSAMAVPRADFEAQCAWLQRSGRVVPLQEWVRRFRSSRRPPALTAITFDDGFASVYDVALPILRRYDLPATVFVVGRTLDGDDVRVDWTTTVPHGGLTTLGAERIREMLGLGITFGSHGHTHRDLTALSPSECERDLAESRARLEQITGTRVDFLAYPFGAHNAGVRQAARRAGYTHAFGTTSGRDPVAPYGIPRAGVYAGDRGAMLQVKTSRLYLPVRRGRAYPLLRRVLKGGGSPPGGERASGAGERRLR